MKHRNCYLALIALTAFSMGAHADIMLNTQGSAGLGTDPFTIVLIRDAGGPVSVSLGQDKKGTLSNINVSGELMTFDYTLPGTGTWGLFSFDGFLDLLDGSTVSDVFRIQFDANSATAHVTFASDTAYDTGTSQQFPGIQEVPGVGLYTVAPITATGNGDINGAFVVDTPEPSSVLGLGLALLGTGLSTVKRHLFNR